LFSGSSRYECNQLHLGTKRNNVLEIFLGSHSGDCEEYDLLGCNAVYLGKGPVFWGIISAPSSRSPEYGGSMFLRNVGLFQNYTALQPRRPYSLKEKLYVLSVPYTLDPGSGTW
jgi:hypothetical protein